jgi:hypothetical protein
MSTRTYSIPKATFDRAEALLHDCLRVLSVLIRNLHRAAKENANQHTELHTHIVWCLWHYGCWWQSLEPQPNPLIWLAGLGESSGSQLVRVGPVTDCNHARALGLAAWRTFERIKWILTAHRLLERLNEAGFQRPSDLLGGPLVPLPKRRSARNAPWWHGTMRYAGSHHDAPLAPLDLHPGVARDHARRWELFSAVAAEVDVGLLAQQVREDWPGADGGGWWEWLQATVSKELAQAMMSRASPPAESDTVCIMRDVIRQTPSGAQAAPKTLLKKAKIQRQAGLDALRKLQELGEYHGFSRDRPRRYRSTDN